MTDNEKYNIYLEVKHQFLLEDAKNFIIDYITDKNGCYEDELEDDDIHWEKYDLEYLISEFEKREDCNVSYNDTWEHVIYRYMEDMEDMEEN